MMIDTIVQADKVPTCINNVRISFHYTDRYKGSPNYKIISKSIQEFYNGWENDYPWLRFLSRVMFRFNDQSITAETQLKIAFEEDRLILSVRNANVHYNFLPSVIYMLVSRHQSHAQMLEELAEHGTDMSQFPTFENAEDRIKSIEISDIKGSGSLVPMETVKKLHFINRSNIHLEHKKSKAPLDPNGEIESYSFKLSGFGKLSPPELHSQIEPFEEFEASGFFVGKEYKNTSNEKFLEIFWSTEKGEPVLNIEDLISQNYAIGELLSVFNYDHQKTIKIETI